MTETVYSIAARIPPGQGKGDQEYEKEEKRKKKTYRTECKIDSNNNNSSNNNNNNSNLREFVTAVILAALRMESGPDAPAHASRRSDPVDPEDPLACGGSM